MPLALSFIVPAHNEEQLLGRTLAALQAAASTLAVPCEIVVVDDASTDRTAAIAQAAGARVVRVTHRQIAASRNAGAKVATGDVFIFVDADTVISAAALAATLDAVASGAVGGGARIALDGPVPLAARAAAALVLVSLRITNLAAGAYIFATREAFEATGGFDETLYATEELSFSRALARVGRFLIVPQQVVTSGRKARTHSPWELARPIALFFRRGFRVRRRREDLGLWYGDRRTDPHEP